MDKTSTPIIYQLIHIGNNNTINLTEINEQFKKEKWLIDKFNLYYNNLPDMPDNLIDKILTKAKVC